MAFDPDAYLAKKSKGGFDPNAYLAAKGQATTEIPIGVRAPEPEPPKPSLYDRFVEGIKGTGRTIADAGTAAFEGVAKPIYNAVAPHKIGETWGTEEGRAQLARDFILTNPAKRHQLERGLSDTLTFGLAQRLGEAADRATGGDSLLHEREDSIEAPEVRSLGQVAGMASPGASTALAKGAGKLVGKFAGKLAPTGAIPGAALGTAKAIAGYELSAPIGAATHAAISGQNPIEAAYEAATDPAGLVIAGTLGAGTGAAQGFARKLRDPKTQEGRTIKTIEDAGGKIRPFGQPVRGGLYETPEMTELAKGRQGVNQAAKRAVGNITDASRENLAKARAQFGADVDQILAENGDQHHLMTETHDLLGSLEKQNQTRKGKVLNKGLDGAIKEVRDLLTTETDQLDTAASKLAQEADGDAVYVTAPAVAVDDMIKVKQYVNDMADWKNRPDKTNRPYRLIAKAIDNDANAVDPRIREMNAKYKSALEPLEETNDILFGKRKSDVNITATKRKSAALKVGRIDDDTQASTTDDLERLGKQSPQNAQELRLVAAKKAMERIRYGEPEVSTSIEKGMRRSHGGMAKHAGAVVGHHLGGILGAVAGYAVGKFAEAPMAAKLRLGLPIAEGIGAFEGAPGTLAARLYLARQAQNENRLQLLGGP